MQDEIELRILEINVSDVQKKLKELGAEKVADRLMKRYVYYFPNKEHGKFVRLRKDRDKITIALKQISEEDKIDRIKEVEVEVSDFETAHKILETLGCITKAYQETKRISYKLNGAEIEIDIWPKIPPVLEIEAKNEEDVYKIVELLGFKKEDTTTLHWQEIYSKYGMDVFDFKELRFDL